MCMLGRFKYSNLKRNKNRELGMKKHFWTSSLIKWVWDPLNLHFVSFYKSMFWYTCGPIKIKVYLKTKFNFLTTNQNRFRNENNVKFKPF